MSSSQRSLLLTSQATSSSSASSSSRALSDRRLFVSNLAPQITEHDLLRLFKPYGTLRKLDFIFHRSGPQKGKPKGYAFVELVEKEGADKAKKALDGRSIKGREVHISYATVNEDDYAASGPHRRRRIEDPAKPTTLSLVKNLKRNDSTDARIAAMEAKLSALQRRTDSPSDASASASASSTTISNSALAPRHPSLPARPNG